MSNLCENEKDYYKFNNCIVDLNILMSLDKRAVKDLRNNTHEIGQEEVITIIREFIRLRNDFNNEKEISQHNKNKLDIYNAKIIELLKMVEDLKNYKDRTEYTRKIAKMHLNNYKGLIEHITILTEPLGLEKDAPIDEIYESINKLKKDRDYYREQCFSMMGGPNE